MQTAGVTMSGLVMVQVSPLVGSAGAGVVGARRSSSTFGRRGARARGSSSFGRRGLGLRGLDGGHGLGDGGLGVDDVDFVDGRSVGGEDRAGEGRSRSGGRGRRAGGG